LEVNEIQKQKIPHMMKFQCGGKALLTIQGRPPLCLKCLQVGHYRNSCNGQTNVSPDFYTMQEFFRCGSFSDAEVKAKEQKEKDEMDRKKAELEKVDRKDDDDDDDDNTDDEMNGENEKTEETEENNSDTRSTKRTQDTEDGELQ
jgi:hypothetical protein